MHILNIHRNFRIFSGLNEVQQIVINHLGMGSMHPMRITWINLQNAVNEQFILLQRCIFIRNDLIIISLHHQNGQRNGF